MNSDLFDRLERRREGLCVKGRAEIRRDANRATRETIREKLAEAKARWC